MSAPAGNNFWEQRSRHGRKKLFETPELLWEAAKEYFEWCKANPWYKVEQSRRTAKHSKKDTTEDDQNLAKLPLPRPFTLHGLCLYLDCSTGYFREFKKDCSEDFVSVVNRIEQVCYDQKFTGAAVGLFNQSIISRDLGLVDKTEVTGKDGANLFSDQSDEDLKQLLADTLTKLNGK